MKFSSIVLLILFQIISPAFSQEYPGKADTIDSKFLKEKVRLQIVLPPNYKPGTKYDVVYILDGGTVKLISQIQEFTENEGYIPPLILVGVFHSDRFRDLSPTAVPARRTSGGGPNLLAFLKNELQPYINKTLPVSGHNILYGHSLGGLFAIYSLLSEPQLFSSYLAVDPSIGWDDGNILKLVREKLATLDAANKTLFITGREANLESMKINILDSLLKTKAPIELQHKMVVYTEETHNSMRLKSIYDGLKYIYMGYNRKHLPLFCYPMNGIVLKDKPFSVFTFTYTNSPVLRYTQDGSTPTWNSAKLEPEHTFTGPFNMHIKYLTSGARHDKEEKGEFILGETLNPLAPSSNLKGGGFSYAYYPGKWESMPNFKNLKPTQSGKIDDDFTFAKLPSKEDFATLFEGQLEIKEDGYYTFLVDADDGARLYLKNKVLIDYDCLGVIPETQSFMLPLKKGFYPLRLEHFQKKGVADLRLKYIVPGSNKPVPIPLELQYSDK